MTHDSDQEGGNDTPSVTTAAASTPSRGEATVITSEEQPSLLICSHQYGVEDLCELETLDEEAILKNFRLRFSPSPVSSSADDHRGGRLKASRPFIGAGGNVMIALNPCRALQGVYDKDMQVLDHRGYPVN